MFISQLNEAKFRQIVKDNRLIVYLKDRKLSRVMEIVQTYSDEEIKDFEESCCLEGQDLNQTWYQLRQENESIEEGEMISFQQMVNEDWSVASVWKLQNVQIAFDKAKK